MAASALSPLSSPRLPSPPPMAEDQLGPKSPVPATEEQQKLFDTLDHGASRRIRPGTSADDMAEGPPLIDLSEIDSAFQLTEHLKALHNFLSHPIGANATIAVDREMAHKLAHPPENVDKTLWLYELCRFLTQKVNAIITALFSDSPPCSSITCPEMRASEWQYLCAVHDPPKSCCAIDYCCHTLDWAANTLTSPKNFPSRLAMGTDQSTQHQQIRNLTNIFRRVYRIFAHAWFQHRDMFWKVEGRTGLYIFFKTVCDVYGLIPEDNYTIPPEAEGVEPSAETPQAMAPPLILKREPSGPSLLDSDHSSMIEAGDHTLSTAGTTKRHRHSPSVGATSVTTVVEESEEEGEEEAAEESQEEPVEAGPSAAPKSDSSEGSAGSAEGISTPEESETGEEADTEGEAVPGPDETTDADADADEPEAEAEEEVAREVDVDELDADGTDAEASVEDESATAAEAPPAEAEAEAEDEVKPKETELPSQAEPEKAEKEDEAALADPDKEQKDLAGGE